MNKQIVANILVINTAENVCFVFALPEFPSFPFPQLQENIYFDSEQYS